MKRLVVFVLCLAVILLLVACSEDADDIIYDNEIKYSDWIELGGGTASTDKQVLYSMNGKISLDDIKSSFSLGLSLDIPSDLWASINISIFNLSVENSKIDGEIMLLGTSCIIDKDQQVRFYYRLRYYTVQKGKNKYPIFLEPKYGWVIRDVDGSVIECICEGLDGMIYMLRDVTQVDYEQNTVRDTNEVLNTSEVLQIEYLAHASSTRKNQLGNTYNTNNLNDGHLNTCWVEGKENDDGIGEWVKLGFNKTVSINSMEIWNGYCKSKEIYEKNNRVKKLSIEFSDGSIMGVSLDDIMDKQIINFDTEKYTNYILVYIDDIYVGTKPEWHDTCISEIKLFGISY